MPTASFDQRRTWLLSAGFMAASSLFSSVDLVALFGVFSAYAAMLTVHWGIEATGPRREG